MKPQRLRLVCSLTLGLFLASLLSFISSSIPLQAALKAASSSSAGSILAWGKNDVGQLGDGTTAQRNSPISNSLLAGITIKAVVAGGSHSLALTSQGQVLAWGNNGSWQLGDSTSTNRTSPAMVPLPASVIIKSIAAGQDHSLALTSDGKIYGWGSSSNGQLGNGSVTSTNLPQLINLPTSAPAKAIAAGKNYTIALTTDGKLYACGYNAWGVIGDLTTIQRTSPVAVSLPVGVIISAISAGYDHALALSADGKLYAWGRNSDGQVGVDSTSSYYYAPVLVHQPATAFTSISAGGAHNLAITGDGKTYAWGFNSDGRLGDGTYISRGSPVLVNLPTSAVAIAVATGAAHSMVLTGDGKAFATGYNSVGELGDGTTAPKANFVSVSLPAGVAVTTLVAGAYHSLALVSESKVSTWGNNQKGQLGDGTTISTNVPSSITLPPGVTAKAIAGGQEHSLALGSDGNVYNWGSLAGLFGNIAPSANLNPGGSQAAVDGNLGTQWIGGHQVPLNLNWTTPATIHRIVAWDRTQNSPDNQQINSLIINFSDGTATAPLDMVSGGPRCIDVSFPEKTVNGVQLLPFDASGTNGFSEVEVWATTGVQTSGNTCSNTKTITIAGGSTTTNYNPALVNFPVGVITKAIVAGGYHSLALTTDGKIYAWGNNQYGQLGDGTTLSKISPVLVNLPPGVTAKAISAGLSFSAALTSDGKVYTWGDNQYGQLGDGTTISKTSPVLVNLPPNVNITTISSGIHHNLALTADGKIYGWGSNASGEVGDGTNVMRTSPVSVNLPPNVSFIDLAGGEYHSLALTGDGKIYAWGINNAGQLGNGSITNSYSPVLVNLPTAISIVSKFNHSLALDGSGKIYAWGTNDLGERGDGTNTGGTTPVTVSRITDATEIATGYHYSMALITKGFTDTPNTSWPTAMPLDFVPLPQPDTRRATVDQYLLQPDGSKWFKFKPGANSWMFVTLTGATSDGKLPANYDITFFKDIQRVYDKLNSSNSTVDISFLSAEEAPTAFMPSVYMPSVYMPSVYMPSVYMPSVYMPDKAPPPSNYNNLEAYSGALPRSLIAVSAQEGLSPEYLNRNSWNNDGEFYVRVRGRDGITSTAAPFHLQVTLVGGSCGKVNAVNNSIPAFNPAGTNPKSLILTDLSRLEGTTEEKSAMVQKLNNLAARTEVGGLVVDLGEKLANGSPKYERVTEANKIGDANPTCPYAKNMVAAEINQVVNSYHPQQYIVLAGPDNVIPFMRYPDLAGLADENEYTPPVLDGSASQASLKYNLVLSDDGYGTTLGLSRNDYVLPDLNLAVGRLVKTAPEIGNMIDAYISTNGVISPSSALVTGYDFVTDVAQSVKQEFEQALSPDNCRNSRNCVQADALIARPNGQNAWSAADLKANFVDKSHGLVFLSGHFSAGSTSAADYSYLPATTLNDSAVKHTNSLVFALGCHSGYDIPSKDAYEGISPVPDWPQVFARKGMTAIAGTGYQYGDTDLIAFSEQLYREVAIQLHTRPSAAPGGKVTVPIGQAFVQAKKRYLATTQLNGMHEKVVLIATLYGLPMMGVTLTSINPTVETPPNSLSPVTSGPGQSLGLASSDYTLQPTLTNHSRNLTNQSNGTTLAAKYLTGKDGVVTNPLEPILPLELRNVSATNMIVRGAGFRGGTYTDRTGIFPLTEVPVTEMATVRPTFTSDVFYPYRPWEINYFDAPTTRLAVIPAQYKSDIDPATGGPSLTGTLRQFSKMDFRLFYSNNTGRAAIVTPPTIWSAVAHPDGNNLNFSVKVTGEPSAGIQAVWVTYNANNGIWQSLDLQPSATDTTVWLGTLPNAPQNIHFMAQAANGVGQVTLANKGGIYYSVDSGISNQPAPTPKTTLLTLELPNGATTSYLDQPVMRAVLQYADPSDNSLKPLTDQTLYFEINGQRSYAKTDQQGIALVNSPGSAATLTLLQPSDTSNLKVVFGGTEGYSASFATQPLSILQRATVLTVTTHTPDSKGHSDKSGDNANHDNSISSNTSDSEGHSDRTNKGVVVTLKESGGQPLLQKTVIFLAVSNLGNPNERHYGLSVVTDNMGRAALNIVGWEAGTYTLNAYFSGTIPNVGTFTDRFYLPSTITLPPITIEEVESCTVPLRSQLSEQSILNSSTGKAGATDGLDNLIDGSDHNKWYWIGYPKAVAINLDLDNPQTLTAIKLFTQNPELAVNSYFQYEDNQNNWNDIPGLGENVKMSDGWNHFDIPNITAKAWRIVVDNTTYQQQIGYFGSLELCTKGKQLSNPTIDGPQPTSSNHRLPYVSATTPGSSGSVKVPELMDGLPSTAWQVKGQPTSATLDIDLETVRTVTSVSFYLNTEATARHTAVQYWDGQKWVTIPSLEDVNTNAGNKNSPKSGGESRYDKGSSNLQDLKSFAPVKTSKLRFVITNKEKDKIIGGYGDIQVFGY